jgi:hypothetical protein
MKREPNPVPLRWPGARTLKAARAAIRNGDPVEIELPLEVHYALFKHLHPQQAQGGSEDIDVSGGAELLEPIATVAGLEELKNLTAAVRRSHYQLHLTSPEPRLRLIPPQS